MYVVSKINVKLSGCIQSNKTKLLKQTFHSTLLLITLTIFTDTYVTQLYVNGNVVSYIEKLIFIFTKHQKTGNVLSMADCLKLPGAFFYF